MNKSLFKLTPERLNHSNKNRIPCFCIFYAPRFSFNQKDVNRSKNLSKEDLKNITVKGGKSFWDTYVKNFLDFSEENHCAVAISENIFNIILPELSDNVDVFISEDPLLIGHGACFRYCLLDFYKSALFFDTDHPTDTMLGSQEIIHSVLKKNRGVEFIRRNPALSPLGNKEFYRHTMGSGIYIKNIGVSIASFFQHQIPIGFSVDDWLNIDGTQSDYEKEDNTVRRFSAINYQKPRFEYTAQKWADFPYYGYDEFLLGLLYEKKYKKREKNALISNYRSNKKIFNKPTFKKEKYLKDVEETKTVYEF